MEKNEMELNFSNIKVFYKAIVIKVNILLAPVIYKENN